MKLLMNKRFSCLKGLNANYFNFSSLIEFNLKDHLTRNNFDEIIKKAETNGYDQVSEQIKSFKNEIGNYLDSNENRFLFLRAKQALEVLELRFRSENEHSYSSMVINENEVYKVYNNMIISLEDKVIPIINKNQIVLYSNNNKIVIF